MTYVATLIGKPPRMVLTDPLLRRAAEILEEPRTPQWLNPGVVADIAFTPAKPLDLKAVAERLRAALDFIPLDIVVQIAQGRRKKLLLADMDSTMIEQECLDELAAEIGEMASIAAITERAMRGDIAFEPALRERVARLKGIDQATIRRLVTHRITLAPGGASLVATMRTHGAHTVLVSGGFSIFTAAIAERIGFDDYRANELMFDAEGRLTGKIAEPILGRAGKRWVLQHFREKFGLSVEETLAIGDGANDLAMLDAAGLGVAFHAKPRVACAATARIDHGDLTALLYVQGYRRSDFVENFTLKTKVKVVK